MTFLLSTFPYLLFFRGGEEREGGREGERERGKVLF